MGSLADWGSGLLEDFTQNAPGALTAYRTAVDKGEQDQLDAYSDAERRYDGLRDNGASMLLAAGAGLLSPTQTGSFAESLGNMNTNLGGALSANRKFEMDRAEKLQTLQLARARLGAETAQQRLQVMGAGLGLIGQAGPANAAIGSLKLQEALTNMGAVPSGKGVGTTPVAPSRTSFLPPSVGGSLPSTPEAPAAPPAGAGVLPGTQVAQTAPAAPAAPQSPADMPAEGAQPAEYQIPGQPAPQPQPGAPQDGGISLQDMDGLQRSYNIIQLSKQRPDLFAYPGNAEILQGAQKAIQDAVNAGVGVDRNGRVGYIRGGLKDPGYLGDVKQAEGRGDAAGRAPYTYVTRTDQFGNEIQVPLDKQVAADHPEGGVGTGVEGANISKDAPQIVKGREALQVHDTELAKSYAVADTQLERLGHLEEILKNFQSGQWAEQKGTIIAGLRSAGFDVPDTATANPAAMQQFLKESTAEVFEQLRTLPGQPRVAEIIGLQKTLMDSGLQPEANRNIIGQMKGLIEYQKKYTEDYAKWRASPQGRAASSNMEFDIAWRKANPVTEFVKAAKKETSARGMEVPPPAQRTVGQKYNIGGKEYWWREGGWEPVEE